MSYIEGHDPLHRIENGIGFVGALKSDGTRKTLFMDTVQTGEMTQTVTFTYEGRKRIHRYSADVNIVDDTQAKNIAHYVDNSEIKVIPGKILRAEDSIIHHIDGCKQTAQGAIESLATVLDDLEIKNSPFKYFSEPTSHETQTIFGYVHYKNHQILFRGNNLSSSQVAELEVDLDLRNMEQRYSHFGQLLRKLWSGRDINLDYDVEWNADITQFEGDAQNRVYISQPNGGIGHTLLSAVGKDGELLHCEGNLSVERGNIFAKVLKEMEHYIFISGSQGRLHDKRINLVHDHGRTLNGRSSIEQLEEVIKADHATPDTIFKFFNDANSTFHGYLHTGNVQTIYSSQSMSPAKLKELQKKLTDVSITMKESKFAKVLKQLFA